MLNKNKLYYKISEVCTITDLKPSVLRFWEKEFKEIRPFKTTSKRRLYTQQNIDAINKVKDLLYNKRMTIEGAKKALRNSNDLVENDIDISEIKKELEDILSVLKRKI